MRINVPSGSILLHVDCTPIGVTCTVLAKKTKPVYEGTTVGLLQSSTPGGLWYPHMGLLVRTIGRVYDMGVEGRPSLDLKY